VATRTWKIRLGRRGDPPGPTRGPSFGGRVGATLFFGVFFAFGAVFLVFFGREIWRGVEPLGWSERRCEILHSAVTHGSEDRPYRPDVAFRTADGGPHAEGSRIQRQPPSYSTWNAAAERLTPYPVGARVQCRVSAQGEAVLEPGPFWMAAWMLLPLVFVASGSFGIAASWRRKKTDSHGRSMPEVLGARAERRAFDGLTLFGALFAVVGGCLLWFMGVAPAARILMARSWDRLACSVESSRVLTHEGDDSTTYGIDILYRWERGHGIERSSRYDFFGGSTSDYADKAAIVRAHPAGSEVACWVHPQRRNEAVLERGATAAAWFAVVPLGFLAGGIAMIGIGRRQAGRRTRARRRAMDGTLPFAPDDAVLDILPDRVLPPGPALLPARNTRWDRVLGVVFAAAFWNGIVAVFVNEAWKAWERGRPDWFLMLFLVPFVLVGVALCWAIVHALLALLNPRPALRIDTGVPRLGEPIEIQWECRGAVHRLDRVRIRLRGTEQATYQVGTDTRAASEIFHEEILVDSPAPACHLGGSASFTIPASSMHSFESAHNQILWTLEFEGEIRRWPNVEEVYPLVVLPRAATEGKREVRRS
jgi:hypothetical protein